MSMYQQPFFTYEHWLTAWAKKLMSVKAKPSTPKGDIMNERRPLDLRDGSPDLDGLYLVEESKKHSIKILGDEVLPNGFTAKGKPCLFENGKPAYVAKNTKNMLSALAAMEKV